MKPLYILKIGGSVATCKNRPGTSIRRKLLGKIAESIASAKKARDFNLILIHGAGAAGHQLAKKYGLQNGTGNDPKKWEGALESQSANQSLNNSLTRILNHAGLRTIPYHTASVIVQENKTIADCNLGIVSEILKMDCIPILYGEMVIDTELGMSVCSGDAIAPYLAEKLGAKRIFFASDIDGIFDRDPHIHKNATLLREMAMADVNESARLTESHNTDVTGGLKGKMSGLIRNASCFLESIEIFNGFTADNFKKVLLDEEFPHTKIILR